MRRIWVVSQRAHALPGFLHILVSCFLGFLVSCFPQYPDVDADDDAAFHVAEDDYAGLYDTAVDDAVGDRSPASSSTSASC